MMRRQPRPARLSRLARNASLGALLPLILLCLPAASASAAPGQVFTFGQNHFGELGNTTNNGTQMPNPSAGLLSLPGAVGSVVELAAGEVHSLVVTSAGQLYAFGENNLGQLGTTKNVEHGEPNPTPAAVILPGASGPVVKVAAGGLFSLALTSTGQLYAFGFNSGGQLGNTTNIGTDTANPTPTPVTLPGAVGPVMQIAAGAAHGLALTSSGQLYAWGSNFFGQLGNETHVGTATPNPTPTPVTLPGAVGSVVQIAAGGDDTLVATSSGQLYTFGENEDGQLGVETNIGTPEPTPTPALVALPGASGPVVQVSAGISHSIVLTASGQVFAFGAGTYGELGTGSVGPHNPTPALVSLPGAVGQPVQVVAGERQSFVVTSSGQLFAFGRNIYGQLGSATNAGTETPNPTPTPVAFPFGTTIDTVARGPEAQHTLALVSELAVLSSTLPAGQVGVHYSATAVSAGGLGAFSWSAEGLPAGLSIAANGQISGTPTSSGASDVVLHVSDIFGVSATSATIPLTIAPAIVPVGQTKVSTAAQLKAGLLAQLGIAGKSAKIAALLKRKGYSYSFKALSAGTLAISWYFLPPGAHVAKKKKVPPILIASGKLIFKAPGTKSLTVKLTRKGQSLLKHRSKLKITEKGGFTATGKAPVTATKTLTLKR
jgi:alpha-tubulin suppressor-like RCC1 family protein